MKGIVKISAVAAIAALALAGCAGSDSGSGSVAADPANLETTIKILAPSYASSTKTDWENIIAEYNKTYPKVKVELQIEGWDDFSSKVQARVQAKDLPDILNDNNFASAADGELLYPITEVMSEDVLNTIEPALLKNGVGADGTQWVVPDVASSRMMAYNTGIFEKAGITTVPATWDELEQACDKIKAASPDVYPYGMPLGREEAQVESSLWLWGAGGDWAEGDTLKAKSDKTVEAFTEMKKLIDKGCTQPNAGTSNRQDVADLFNNGKVAMMMSHSGLLGVTAKDYPEIKYDVAPVPSKDGKGVALGVTDFILAFDNGDDARKQATKGFLDLFYSDAMYKNWYAPSGLLPVTDNVIEQGKSEAGSIDKKFYDALSTVRFLPVGNPQWDTLQGALQSTAGKLTAQEPAAVLDAIQSQVDAES